MVGGQPPTNEAALPAAFSDQALELQRPSGPAAPRRTHSLSLLSSQQCKCPPNLGRYLFTRPERM